MQLESMEKTWRRVQTAIRYVAAAAFADLLSDRCTVVWETRLISESKRSASAAGSSAVADCLEKSAFAQGYGGRSRLRLMLC
jgi:hypothetical protein